MRWRIPSVVIQVLSTSSLSHFLGASSTPVPLATSQRIMERTFDIKKDWKSDTVLTTSLLRCFRLNLVSHTPKPSWLGYLSMNHLVARPLTDLCYNGNQHWFCCWKRGG